jgi:hypothetical protein
VHVEGSGILRAPGRSLFLRAGQQGLFALFLSTTSAVIAFSPFGSDSYLRGPADPPHDLAAEFLQIKRSAAGAIGQSLLAQSLDLTGQLGRCKPLGRGERAITACTTQRIRGLSYSYSGRFRRASFCRPAREPGVAPASQRQRIHRKSLPAHVVRVERRSCRRSGPEMELAMLSEEAEMKIPLLAGGLLSHTQSNRSSLKRPRAASSGFHRSPRSRIRSGTASMRKSSMRKPRAISSQVTGIDTVARGFGRTE